MPLISSSGSFFFSPLRGGGPRALLRGGNRLNPQRSLALYFVHLCSSLFIFVHCCSTVQEKWPRLILLFPVADPSPHNMRHCQSRRATPTIENRKQSILPNLTIWIFESLVVDVCCMSSCSASCFATGHSHVYPLHCHPFCKSPNEKRLVEHTYCDRQEAVVVPTGQTCASIFVQLLQIEFVALHGLGPSFEHPSSSPLCRLKFFLCFFFFLFCFLFYTFYIIFICYKEKGLFFFICFFSLWELRLCASSAVHKHAFFERLIHDFSKAMESFCYWGNEHATSCHSVSAGLCITHLPTYLQDPNFHHHPWSWEPADSSWSDMIGVQSCSKGRPHLSGSNVFKSQLAVQVCRHQASLIVIEEKNPLAVATSV